MEKNAGTMDVPLHKVEAEKVGYIYTFPSVKSFAFNESFYYIPLSILIT